MNILVFSGVRRSETSSRRCLYEACFALFFGAQLGFFVDASSLTDERKAIIRHFSLFCINSFLANRR